MTGRPARVPQTTMTARTEGLNVPPSVPAPYTTAVISGPKRNACRRARGPPPSDGPAVTAGPSLVLNHIPEPLVRTRVLDPLHLGGVPGPVYGVGLSGELDHPGGRRGDLSEGLTVRERY